MSNWVWSDEFIQNLLLDEAIIQEGPSLIKSLPQEGSLWMNDLGKVFIFQNNEWILIAEEGINNVEKDTGSIRAKFKKREKIKTKFKDDCIRINYRELSGVVIHSIDKLSRGKIIKDFAITAITDSSLARESYQLKPHQLWEYNFRNVHLEFELEGLEETLHFEGKFSILTAKGGELLLNFDVRQREGTNLLQAIELSNEKMKEIKREAERNINRKFTF